MTRKKQPQKKAGRQTLPLLSSSQPFRLLSPAFFVSILLIAACGALLVHTIQQHLGNQKEAQREPTLLETATPMIELSEEEQAYLQALGPITVCPAPDWMPFEFVDETGKFIGIAADLLELVARRLGIQFAYVPVNDRETALLLSSTGNVLILPFLNQTPSREKWLVFTDPLLTDQTVFVTHADFPNIYHANTVPDGTLVFPTGASMEDRIRADFPHLQVMHVADEEKAFSAVQRKQADMTLRSLITAAYVIRKNGLLDLKIAGSAPDEYRNELRMGVLKSEPMLRDILNKGIATITARERDAIINRYINITVIRAMDYGFVLRITYIVGLLICLAYYWNLRLRKINAALIESERSKAVFLNNLPGAAYQRRRAPEWAMEYLSEGCLALTGYSQKELTGGANLCFDDLVEPPDRPRLAEYRQTCATNAEPGSIEYRIRTRSGEQKWVYERGAPRLDKDKQVVGLEGLLVDITAQKQTEAALQRAKDAAEATNRSKSEFLANISHEIRTPLSALVGLSQALFNQSRVLNLPDNFSRLLEQIRSGGGYISLILTNLLDLSSVEHHHNRVRRDPVALDAWSRSVRDIIEPIALSKNILLHWEDQCLSGQTIQSDKIRLSHILMNLAHNAVKFTPEGGCVTVSFEYAPDLFAFTVEDDGPGLPDDPQRLFNAFEQSESVISGLEQGVGLGLYIVRSNAALLSGQISVANRPSGGAHFRVEWPR